MGIVSGLTGIAGGIIGGKKRRSEQKTAQGLYDSDMAGYRNLDTSNPYANMENTMEDLTVNTQAADFAAQQQQQGLSNIMGSMNQAAGGSGIAALAQSLANQQSQSAQQASVSIGQQEQSNQMLGAQEAGRLQGLDIQGQYASREQEAGLMSERAQIDANELAASEEQIQAARAARSEAAGQFMGGVGSLATTAMGLPTEQLGKLGNLGIGLAGVGNKLGFR